MLSIHGVRDMYIIDKENNAPIALELAEILNFGRILQNSAKFGGTRQCGKPAKHHRMSFQLTNQCSITYVSFRSYAHGVYTIPPHLVEHAHREAHSSDKMFLVF
jgi:hypothetical protein